MTAAQQAVLSNAVANRSQATLGCLPNHEGVLPQSLPVAVASWTEL